MVVMPSLAFIVLSTLLGAACVASLGAACAGQGAQQRVARVPSARAPGGGGSPGLGRFGARLDPSLF